MKLAARNRIFRSVIPLLARPGRTLGADAQRTATVQWVSLAGNGTFDLDRPFGCRLQCTRGSIWITHVGDGRDIVVEAGSSFIGDRNVPMFIQALGDAEFCIDGAEGVQSTSGGLPCRADLRTCF